jgi:hypothetical protein
VGTVMASGFTLGNTIRKRMGLPPLGSLFSLFYQFYRLSNSHGKQGAFHFFAPSACLSIRGEKVCLPQRY